MSYHARISMPPLMVTSSRRRMREHETQRLRQVEHGRHGFEVVAVGAKPVQPDHGADGVAGVDLYGLKHRTSLG